MPGNADRDRPGLVRFRGAEHDVPADIREGPSYVDPAATQVDVAETQRGCLAPSQAGAGEQQDEHAP